MEQAILIVHVLAALGIVALILIQQGKGADVGASFGAGASQTLFGSSGGGNVLTKTTAIFATIFFVTSFGLAIVAKQKADISGGVDAGLPEVIENVVDPVDSEIPTSDIPDIDTNNTANDNVLPENADIPESTNTTDIPLEETGSQELSNDDIPE